MGKNGLVLSGGGARGAYQAGVLLAASEIAEDMGVENPLPILVGVSAGAINTTFLAAHPGPFRQSCEALVGLWGAIQPTDVFSTDLWSLAKIGFRWATDLALGSVKKERHIRGLLDTSPLRRFLSEHIAFGEIENQLQQGRFEAVAISATDYADSIGVTFYQTAHVYEPWHRSRRRGQKAEITVEHVMASSAIPLFFPAVGVGEAFYGDGCVRNLAPLSPAIHLGASQLLVVSVRSESRVGAVRNAHRYPSLARVLGLILNAILMDSIEQDLDLLKRMNTIIQQIPNPSEDPKAIRPVDALWIRPSGDIGALAGEHGKELPGLIRYLLSGMGSRTESQELLSYLLFEGAFTSKLAEMGYQDARAQSEAFRKFFKAGL